VFFLGLVDEHGLVDEVTVHCRGHKSAVPALKQVGRPGDVVLHNHPSGRLIPSEPDLALAAHYGQEGVGFFIIDNAAESIYVVVEPLQDTDSDVDPEAVVHALTAADKLPSMLPDYEPRESQVAMAQRVAEAQNGREITIVEAGTGTGKSLAYLLPSAMRAVRGNERVAIATRTKHLQQQLVTSDVPVVRRLHPNLEVAILKGRGNYLCRRKLGDRLKEAGDDADAEERGFLHRVREWAAATAEGDIDDLPFVPSRDLWELVQSNTEHTLRVRCPHYEECFYYSSRRNAAKANLLVVNHHLLLADMALRQEGMAGGLLPRYEHVVLDEAHHLEDVATDFAGREVTTVGLLRHLGRLRPTRGRRKGLAVRLRQAVDEEEVSDTLVELRKALDDLLEATEDARTTLRLHFEDVGWTLVEALGNDGENAPRPGRRRRSRTFRLLDGLKEQQPSLYGLLEDRLGDVARTVTKVAVATEEVKARLDDMPRPFRGRFMQVGMDLATVQRRLVDASGTLGQMLTANPELVRWIDIRFSQEDVPQPRFILRPIEARGVVLDIVVPAARSLTLTSATLTVAGGFEHFTARTGLDHPDLAGRLRTAMIPSPFDYSSQVYLGVPQDLPMPHERSYADAVTTAVTEAVRIAEGRTFVLLTSYRMLNKVGDAVGRRLGYGFTILKQGDLPRERLLDLFRSTKRAVLFGTDSFWEGVDVRGEALSCVILPKLPFRVPTEPVQVARAEKVEARGGDAFRELSVPQAVLKFRQGFGRLVRHRNDRGVVLVLDVRILRKGYGRRFLRSLPPGVEPSIAPLEGVLNGMAGFLRQD
jgi:ATP-dependent DNA helicase DinG